jgi:hydrogenase/urease accessory protein HupE
MKRMIVAIMLLLISLAGERSAQAHALQPGYLELQLLGHETWRAYWRIPSVQGKAMAITVKLPDNCKQGALPEPAFDGNAWVSRWTSICAGGLAGGTISVPGLENTSTDVLVRYELTGGAGEARRLTPDEPFFTVPSDPGIIDVLESYFSLGVDHILWGFDHLLFVFALILLIRDRWRLVGAITAFTVAHSITMAAVTLGFVSLPGPPVEAVIALSIMFLASEFLQRDDFGERLSERFPWVVSFSFGLLHGFGFAGALLEIGLPRSDVPLALLSFNVGVEAGQLLFVAAVLAGAWMLSRLFPGFIQAVRAPHRVPSTLVGYAIGGTAAIWFVQRVAAF